MEFLPLNAEQEVAANAIDGNFVCISGPGSGKTTVLVRRYVNMLSRGIQERDILNLTFTAEAAKNMVERVGVLGSDKMFRTFHSFALDLIKNERAHLPFRICDEVIPVYGQDLQLTRDLLTVYPAISSSKDLREKIMEWKCSNVLPEQAIVQEQNSNLIWSAYAYADYEKKCREQGWLDFDSLIKETVRLLETNDAVRARNQRKYIAVDECQDTDVVQFRLLQLIYGGNIFVVGDENQLIYEWRSAQSGNLSNFPRVFPGTQTLYMGQNYRSTQSLVEFFRHILPVDNGISSHMVSTRPTGVSPRITEFRDDYQEASVVLSRIQSPGETAIIARTNRQLLTIQKQCFNRGIKSSILGRKNLWQQAEVAHLLNLAKAKKEDDPRLASEVLPELIHQHGLMRLYRWSANPLEKDPIENLNDVVKMAAKRGTLAEFLDWFRRFTHASRSKKTPDPILTLTTVHQAKGREWKHVFVVGAKQGLMPHKEGELLEEHRIFFVACSRAADTLDISFYGHHSQFLNEFVDQIEDYNGLLVRQ